MKVPRDLSGADIVKVFQRLGFTVSRQTASHAQLSKGDLRVTIPMHHSVAIGTFKSILRQANVSLTEFLNS
jgi:predicted RNA binding protein YcfA (HicA-like mRNA interferase family)